MMNITPKCRICKRFIGNGNSSAGRIGDYERGLAVCDCCLVPACMKNQACRLSPACGNCRPPESIENIINNMLPKLRSVEL